MSSQIKPRLILLLKMLSKGLCLFVFVIGALTLIGWKFDIIIFKSIFPHLPVIAPNTALALILASVALFLLQFQNINSPVRYFAYAFAVIVAIIGLLTAFEYLFNSSIGIDNLLFKNAIGPNGQPIRMSPQSALNFLIISFSLLLINVETRKKRLPSQFLIIIVGFISLFSFFGFIHNVPGFYTISPYKGMAAHTAAAFILLFFAIFIARPDRGLTKIFSSESISGFVSRRLFLSLFLLVVADILVMLGQRAGYYDSAQEALAHVLLLIGVFIYLIFIGFASLERVQTIEEIDRAKSEFISFVSHQLRNPLTAIKWNSDALLNNFPLSREKQEICIKDINRSASAAMDLVSAFLNVYKIEEGSFLTEAKGINIKDIAENILNELSEQIQAKNLTLEKEYKGGLSNVVADSKLIRIVLENLLTNAVKYTPENNKITIVVSKTDNELNIQVSDVGIGIPQDQQASVFTKLFRAENIKSKTEGSGLGLYMIKILLEKIGGKIWFESQENRGSTFYVSLPLNGGG